jgi:FkbM family methyltransferase
MFVPRGGLCFDVGANVGNRSALFLELGARVVAVEPQQDCQRALEELFGHDPRFTLVGKALGPQPGIGTLKQTSVPASTISSMSADWIDRVRSSGRFREYEWTRSEQVEITTLDALIAEHGLPAFCKIDVEGFEDEVLRGLSSALPGLSLEFTPEHLDSTERCLARLEELGPYEYNYSLYESLELATPQWGDCRHILEALRSLAADGVLFGDIYARLRTGVGFS